MGKHTEIAWCHSTFNICWGCIKSTRGCDNCYAERESSRWGFPVWGPGVERRTMSDAYWQQPLKWDRAAAAAGERHRVFCSSMTDVFLHDETVDRERLRLWPLIEQTPNLDWLLLTKHPERFSVIEREAGKLPENVWLGVSIESNDERRRADYLRAVDASVRWISFEPLLGDCDAVDLRDIGWFVVGGESGHHARPMQPQWARNLVARGSDCGIPVFVKQLGSYWSTGLPGWQQDVKGGDIDRFPMDLRVREFPMPELVVA